MMNDDDLTLTYQIFPKIPIKDLVPGKCIRTPRTMQLTKHEAYHCIKYGPVYRVFPGKKPIRVTGDNIDSLHRSTFMPNIKKEEHKKEETKDEEVIEELSNDTLEVSEEEDKNSDKALPQPPITVASNPNKQNKPQPVNVIHNNNKKKHH